MLRVRLYVGAAVTVALTSASNIPANTTQLPPCQQQPVTACQHRQVTVLPKPASYRRTNTGQLPSCRQHRSVTVLPTTTSYHLLQMKGLIFLFRHDCLPKLCPSILLIARPSRPLRDNPGRQVASSCVHYRASITEAGPGQTPGTGRPGARK